MYYRGANAALLLYDITNAKTFDDIRGWLQGMFLAFTSISSILMSIESTRTQEELSCRTHHLYCWFQDRSFWTSSSHIRSCKAFSSQMVPPSQTAYSTTRPTPLNVFLYPPPFHVFHKPSFLTTPTPKAFWFAGTLATQ